MKHLLNELSKQEIALYEKAVSLQGSMEDKTQQLKEAGVFAAYKILHQAYLLLFEQTTEPDIKSEALKRLIFLNWYSILEPPCFTGIAELSHEVIASSFEKLDKYLTEQRLDKEFLWMLSFYSCWDYIILMFSDPDLPELTKFVHSIDTEVLHVPKHQLPKGTMDNRGQLGMYWQSLSVEKE